MTFDRTVSHRLPQLGADEIAPLAEQSDSAHVMWVDTHTDATLLRAHWPRLATDAGEPNCFYESWALPAATDALLQPDEVRLFTLWIGEGAAERLVGLLPIHADARYGRWPFPHMRNWLHANAFLGSPLVAKGHERVFWSALLREMDDKPGANLFFHIESMALGGPLEAALLDVAKAERRPIGLVAREERAFIGSLDDPQAYFEDAVRGKKRKELRRQQRRLEEEGEVVYERFDGAGAKTALARWLEEFLALEKAGWKGENGSALACEQGTERMFRKTLMGAAETDHLQLLTMRLDGKAIAMLVNFLSPPGAFSFKTAYDENYSRYSPGVLLQRFNLELMTRPEIEWCDSCAAEGHPMIDHLWRERRSVGRYSVGIGGPLRRALFKQLLNIEEKRTARREAAVEADL